MSIFYRYVRLHELAKPFGSIWTSGWVFTAMTGPHGEYAVLGEFRCCKGAQP